MGFLMRGLLMLLLLGCAKSFSPVLREPPLVPKETKVEVPVLEGSFKLISGEVKTLAQLSEKPFLLLMVSETCTSCREETEGLMTEFEKSGLPSEINMFSVVIDLKPDELKDWSQSFSKPIPWSLGSDDDQVLFDKYFSQHITPAILYFNPANGTLKRWQKKLPIEELKQETGPWY